MDKPLISFDFALKYLLKDKGNYDIVEGFISALLKAQGHDPIKIVALLDTESNKEEYSQKRSIADLVVEDEQHRQYIIEIERQVAKQCMHKSCFNTSRMIVDHVGAGNDYSKIKKIIHISLLYFDIGDAPIYEGKTIFQELESKQRLIMHFIDRETGQSYDATDIFPEYVLISIPRFNDKVKQDIDEWLYVMKHQEVKPEFRSPCMEKLAQRLSVLNMSESERNDYVKYMKQIVSLQDVMDTAQEQSWVAGMEKGLEKGREEGLEEGLQKGIEKGLQQGIEKGLQQGIEEGKRAVARQLLSKGLDIKLISESTGLPEHIIKQLV